MVILGAMVIVGFEVWRRAIAPSARWVNAVTWLLMVGIAGGICFTPLYLRSTITALDDVNPAEKASVLANHISTAMLGTAIALGCGFGVIGVLGWATWRRTKAPTIA